MTTLKLKHAVGFAALMMDKLEGRVTRVEVAGSVRRQRETVNNIDLVLIPKADPQREGHTIPFMFRGEMVRMVDGMGSPFRIIKFAELLFRPLPEASASSKFALETVFEKESKVPEGIRVNISVATEENWGHMLLYRTGSREFNGYLGSRALSLGLVWSPFSSDAAAPDGLFDPDSLAAAESKTEKDMFKALKLKFVEPKDREIKR